jgi:hypothetical protein
MIFLKIYSLFIFHKFQLLRQIMLLEIIIYKKFMNRCCFINRELDKYNYYDIDIKLIKTVIWD